MTYDLLIKGGHVLDPGQGLDAHLDIAIAGGKIARIAADIEPDDAARVIEVRGPGRHVVPGLIDLHTHVANGAITEGVGMGNCDAGEDRSRAREHPAEDQAREEARQHLRLEGDEVVAQREQHGRHSHAPPSARRTASSAAATRPPAAPAGSRERTAPRAARRRSAAPPPAKRELGRQPQRRMQQARAASAASCGTLRAAGSADRRTKPPANSGSTPNSPPPRR